MFRQRHQAGDARFGGQQVVEIAVQLAGGRIVPDVEHLPLRIEQENEIHFLEIGFGQAVDVADRASRSSARISAVASFSPKVRHQARASSSWGALADSGDSRPSASCSCARAMRRPASPGVWSSV